jgi:DNA-binding transcriptional LysR family regulator
MSLNGQAPAWQFVDEGKPFVLPLQPLVDATDMAPLLPMVLQDLGVAYIAAVSVDGYLQSGALVSALDDFMPQHAWLYAAYAQRRHNSAALAALLSFLEQETTSLKAAPAYKHEPTPAPIVTASKPKRASGR